MSRARNYGFDRRRRDDLRRAKQEAKRQRKSDRAETGAAGPEMGEAQSSAPEPGVWEWFSASRGRTAKSPAGSRPPSDPPDDWILLTEVDEEHQPPPPSL
jgi:hypothetical protein